MNGFVEFLKCLGGLVFIILFVMLCILAVKFFIILLPFIAGIIAVLFIGYVFLVGLVHFNEGFNTKK